MNAELITAQNGITFYLSVMTFEFPETEPGYTTVYAEIEGESYSEKALRLEGGQKLILPQNLQEVVVDALVEGKEVTLTVGRYQETLIPDNFNKTFCPLVTQ